MQIFLTTLNPGTYVFRDLGDFTVVHPVGPIPLIEPIGEFTPEDIVISNDLIVEAQAGNIELTNEGGETLNNINDLQEGDQGLFVSLTDSEQIGGQKSFTTGLDVIGTTDYELSISNDDDIPNKKYVDDLVTGIAESNDLSSIVTWAIVPDAFISESSVTQHEGAIDHDALTNFVANEHIDWTQDQGATNINIANIELGLDDLTDADTTTNSPLEGAILYFDGTTWSPTAFGGAADEIIFLANGCVAEFIDTTGLDFCNTQIGPTAGSAFYIAKRGLGTIANPLPVTDQTKIGGYAFLAVDGVTVDPGYVGAEMSSFAQGDQDAINGGANLEFNVTEQGTKTAVTALEIEDNGTLSVAGQTDYELKVLDDDDIPNKKYVDDALVPQDLATVRLRQTGSVNPIPTAWTDFDWNTTDEQNNTVVLEYTGTPADEIDIKEAGLYLISWAISADDEVDVRLTNNGTVVPGSFHTVGDKTDANQNLHANAKTIAATLSVGSLVLQIQAITTAEFTVADSATISITRLSGVPGSQGPAGVAGTQGVDGETGFGVYGWADTVGTTGALTDGLGLTVVRNGTGSYTYSFTDNPPTASYAVYVQGYDVSLTDFNTFVSNRTTSGFDVNMGEGDNGTAADVAGDADHTVIVIRGNGLPAGSNTINVNSNGTPATNTPHGTLNFSTAFTVTDAGGGVVDIGSTAIDRPFSVFKAKSAVGDQSTNYNTTAGEIPLVLTGTTLGLGTSATDFTNNNGSVTCNFTGSVRVTFGVPHTSTGARPSLKSVTQQDTGSGFVNVGAAEFSYIRSNNGHNKDSNKGSEIFSCSTGDVFRVGMRRSEDSSVTSAINILENTFIQIERLS